SPMCIHLLFSPFFFFNVSSSTVISTLSLHDALPISVVVLVQSREHIQRLVQNVMVQAMLKLIVKLHLVVCVHVLFVMSAMVLVRSEEHTSELQSRFDLVCRLLLEKKKNKRRSPATDA